MELDIIKFLQANSNQVFDFIFTLISYVASFYAFIVIAILLFLLVDRIFAYFFTGTYILGVSFNYLLKKIINRPRPFEVSSEIRNMLPTIGESMPSGHMLSVSIMSVFLIYLVLKSFKSKIAKISCIIAIVLFNFLTIISRMYLGQHYISDCIVGFVLGITIGLVGLVIYTKREKIYEYYRNRKQKKSQQNIEEK